MYCPMRNIHMMWNASIEHYHSLSHHCWRSLHFERPKLVLQKQITSRQHCSFSHWFAISTHMFLPWNHFQVFAYHFRAASLTAITFWFQITMHERWSQTESLFLFCLVKYLQFRFASSFAVHSATFYENVNSEFPGLEATFCFEKAQMSNEWQCREAFVDQDCPSPELVSLTSQDVDSLMCLSASDLLPGCSCTSFNWGRDCTLVAKLFCPLDTMHGNGCELEQYQWQWQC